MDVRLCSYGLGTDDCMDAGGRATHDYRDIGGRVTPGAVTEEAKAEYTEIRNKYHPNSVSSVPNP